MSEDHDEPRLPKASAFFYLKLALVLALPLLLAGLSVWWYLGSGVQDELLETQAERNAQTVQAAIGDRLIDDGLGSVLIFQKQATADSVDEVLVPALGLSELEIIAADGRLVFSTGDATLGSKPSLVSVDRGAFRGRPGGVLAPGGETVDAHVHYAVPLRFDTGGEVQAIARLTVTDEPLANFISGAQQTFRSKLINVLLACWLLLFAISAWFLRSVRAEAVINREIAMSDSLTGLANRMQFHNRLDEAIAAAGRDSGEKVGLLMLDLDGFKAINDTGGHAAGDRLLRRVAAKLEDATRRNEIACRLGGDEFAILVPRLSDREELVAMANRLHNELDLNVDFTDGRSLRTSASIGLAVFPEDAEDSDELVAVADIGMYTVKASRRAKMRAGVAAGAG